MEKSHVRISIAKCARCPTVVLHLFHVVREAGAVEPQELCPRVVHRPPAAAAAAAAAHPLLQPPPGVLGEVAGRLEQLLEPGEAVVGEERVGKVDCLAGADGPGCGHNGWMDWIGWMDGLDGLDGWMDGLIDGWIEGWIDGWIDG